jgi:hypothetical protein
MQDIAELTDHLSKMSDFRRRFLNAQPHIEKDAEPEMEVVSAAANY